MLKPPQTGSRRRSAAALVGRIGTVALLAAGLGAAHGGMVTASADGGVTVTHSIKNDTSSSTLSGFVVITRGAGATIGTGQTAQRTAKRTPAPSLVLLPHIR